MELSELVKLVAEDPDAVDPFLVYADDLQERGDPRGELIALEMTRLQDPHDEDRIRAVAKHLDRHRHELLGPLVDLIACLADEKWYLGFLKRVTLRHPEGCDPNDLARWLEYMLSAPSCAFLRDLTITPLLSGDYAPIIAPLAEHGRNLRHLRLGPGHARSTRVDLTGIARGLPELRSLAIASTRIQIEAIRSPDLAELDLWINELTDQHIQALQRSELPSLRSLSIALNRGRISALPRYALGSMPSLIHLRVDAHTTSELAGFVAELAASDLAPQLETLAIDGAGLADIEALVDAEAAFTALRHLAIGSRDRTDDALDPFRSRGVEASMRWSISHFDPWEEETQSE